MSKVNELPSGWSQVQFEEAVDIISDRGFRIKQKNYLSSGRTPVVDQGEGLIGGYTDDTEARIETPLPVIVFGDHTRRFKFVSFPFAVGADGVKLFHPVAICDPKFLFLQLETVDLEDRGYGRHYQHLRKELLLLPPFHEQTRIVAKVEELLSDLDAGVAELKAAHKKLGQYRQALLKAAVAGTLTAEWRAERAGQGEVAESGAELLARILTERRAHWQAKQLAKFTGQGKTPPKGWQEKYLEPVKPDTTVLPALPEGWVWAIIDQLSPGDLANGRSVPSADVGAKVLRLTAVKNGCIDLNECKIGSWSDDEAKPFAVVNGDLLIVRGNGSLALVGRAGLVANVSTQVAYPDTMIRLRVVESIVRPAWIGLIWDTSIIRGHIEQRARTSAGIYKISQPDIVSALVPVPPLEEQDRLLGIFEQGGEEIRSVQATLDQALKQSAAQRQNILKAAFSGQLVPQDPNDEPASQLLERIRTERAARGGTGKSRKRQVHHA